jgi:hypothetical protein
MAIRRDNPTAPTADALQRGGGRVAVSGIDALSSASMWVGAIASAVCDEIQVEPEFAACFDAWIQGIGQLERGGRSDGDGGSGGGDGVGGALVYALLALERELGEDLNLALRSFRTLEGHALAAVRALAPLASAVRSVVGESALAQLRELCAQISEGWCAQLEVSLAESMSRALRLETWHSLSADRPRSSSAVDLFTQLDQLAEVFIAFGSLQPLQPADLRAFTGVAERHVVAYATALVDGCAPLLPSPLQGDAHRLASAAAQQTGWLRSSVGRNSEARNGDAAPVEAQSWDQLCLRLNNCVWAASQLQALADKMVTALPSLSALARPRVGGGGLEDLMASGVAGCNAAATAIGRYVARRAVYFELGPQIASSLYRPSPLDPRARLAPLLQRLSPTLGALAKCVHDTHWRHQALLAVLGDFCLALSAVLESPDRAFAPEHAPVLKKDLEILSNFFMDGGLLDKQVVLYSVSPLRALAEAACSAG